MCSYMCTYVYIYIYCESYIIAVNPFDHNMTPFVIGLAVESSSPETRWLRDSR